MQQRREFLRAFGALSAAVAAPSFAGSSAGEAFDAAVADKPWLRAFKGVSDATQDLRCEALTLTGDWPAALRGRFYRNGPALFERGGQRYHHWFDGDGMVQQFSFNGTSVRHVGRLVRTAKLRAEQQAGRFLYSAFGTAIRSDAPAQGPDTFNTANTNAIEHAGRVLAMWEGGSAYALDPKDLATQGPVTWQDGLQQLPFSAHPKVDAGGQLWNIGTSGQRLIAWHIDPQGRLVDAQLGESPYPGGMVHDMAATTQYLVIPLPPVKLDFGRIAAGGTPEQAYAFDSREPLRILVLRKDDITQRRVFELPAQMVFHVGNAFERADGCIALSFVGASDHRSLVQSAVALVAGRPGPQRVSSTQLAVLDLASGRASVESLGDAVEFPRIDPRRIGLPARYLLNAAQWKPQPAGRGSLFHGITLRDLQTGREDRFDYGEQTVVEEHILVPKPGRADELDAWVLGTSFDAKRQLTQVSVFDARRIADGPLAQATLPYALPLGFHGNFTPAAS
ncbi:carotenoid oxygenase family protein [Aquabacterium sp.]|uniref:carotenoid oxygenase family protein n=1 Tax=Aquabacterium sp. TaxID=1872578 RepID=UPI002D108C3B|nr:carotenoid oxygenase family protein [Aquabacterium sp.]HSW07083.1 carotenoid oxygenase family protein [Aquabacterium sp.]